jgi:hypothetical protein
MRLLNATRLLNVDRSLNAALADVVGIVAVPSTAIAASTTIDLRTILWLLGFNASSPNAIHVALWIERTKLMIVPGTLKFKK